MKFGGYWVSAVRGKIEVTSAEFDETELSDHSDWKEAWQNEDPDHAHGFVDPLAMLHDVSKRIAGELTDQEFEAATAKFREGTPCPVNDINELALLIQLLIPKTMSRTC